MSSDSFIKDQLSKVKSIFPNPLSFRQTGSTTIQGDGTPFSVKQTHGSKSLSRSSTDLLATCNAELKTASKDPGAGPVSSSIDPSSLIQFRTINVVLFGETGVGKSSVINLIARKEVAKVSSDVNGCTLQSTRYDIPFDNMNFSIFDTIGLEEPQMGVNGYLKAIEKAYELIVKLGAAGGIHLLLFCMRGGRITATTQSNYRLFCECLCNTKVPIALVFTGLEREVEMEDWWTRNKTHIEHYGIKSDGHACITAVQDDMPGEDLKYKESQGRIRDLLKTCALKNEAFLPEPHTWFAKLGRGMRSFIEKHRNPKRRDVMRVLTHRCKLDTETAKKIADMMEKGDTEAKDGTPDGHPGNWESKDRSNPPDEREEDKAAKKLDPPPIQLREAEPSTDAVDGTDRGEAPNESVAGEDALGNDDGRTMKTRNAGDHTPTVELNDIEPEAGPSIDQPEGNSGNQSKKTRNSGAHTPVVQYGDVKSEAWPSIDQPEGNGGDVQPKKSRMGGGHIPAIQHGNVEPEARPDIEQPEGNGDIQSKKTRRSGDHIPAVQHGDVKPEAWLYIDQPEGNGGVQSKKTRRGGDHIPAVQHGNVESKRWPSIDQPEGSNGGRAKKTDGRDRTIQHGDIQSETGSRIDRLKGSGGGRAKKNEDGKDRALATHVGVTQAASRIDDTGGDDGGRAKKKRNAGDQSQEGMVEQTKPGRDDVKKKPGVTSTIRPSGSRQFARHGPQS